eukprot:TRINITY_DN84604_c0_g1_i1.p1 TRINITY_DN84604_c0_g1~~TRINITY_DN84604_c0_g1_i1.p1  ORF type:complete len:406 (+),score=49.60 TRINITY_DN84604_c0_g1_i1:47-1219(+)
MVFMTRFQSILLLSVISGAFGKPTTFVTIGDWGGSSTSAYHAANQHSVAKQMGLTAADAGISFVLNTGDNFYYCGIQNTSDVQLKIDFEDVYTQDSLNVPWYGSLGNHEYGYNVDAQLQYKDPKGRWFLPARYYSKRLQIGSGKFMSLIVLDTSPCVKAYRSDDPSGWDPCGSDYTSCAPHDEGTCHFNSNILTQDCGAQLKWFKGELQKVPKDDWLIIVGHHKAYEINVEDFITPMMDRGFDLYLNGHTHTLDQYTINGKSSFITSGAGSMVHTKDQDDLGSSRGTVWKEKSPGFTLHTFSEDFTQLKTDYIDNKGNTIHSFTVKQGQGPSPSPPPSPSGGSCKDFGCTPYVDGQSCQCNKYCEQQDDCCDDYQDVCGPGDADGSGIVV